MAWTTPRTWVASELVTATLLNTHLRDNLNALKSPPTDRAAELAGTFSTSSTSFVSVTNAEVEITTTGGKLMIGTVGTLGANTTLVAAISLLIDGTRHGNTTLGLQRVNVPGASVNGFGFVYLSSNLAAGNHTVALQVSTSPGSAVSVPQWFLWVQEA
jgi:hypothetical protein